MLGEARGGRAHSVSALCDSLAGLGEEAWQQVLAAASERDEARQAFRAERERLRREVAVADTVLEEREATYTALRGDLLEAERAREHAEVVRVDGPRQWLRVARDQVTAAERVATLSLTTNLLLRSDPALQRGQRARDGDDARGLATEPVRSQPAKR